MKTNNKTLIIFFEALLFCAVMAFIIFTKIDVFSAIAFVLICLLIPLFVIEPYYALLALIIIRSATDIYTESIFINIFNIVELNFSSILGILVIAWSLYIILREKINVKKIPLFWPWTLFIAIASLSLMYSVNFSDSLRMLTRLFSIYFIYFISFFYFRMKEEKKKYFFLALFVSSLAPIMLGIYQIIASAGYIGQEGLSRVYGTFAHPNAFAFNLFLYFFIFSITYAFTKEKRIKNPLLIYLSTILILILFTLTRSAWIGICIFILFLLFLYKKKNLLKYILWIVSLIFFFFIIVNFTPLKYFDFNQIKFVRRLTTSETTLSSWQWRIKSWTEMSQYVYESPIIGYGIDSYKTLREKQINDVYESTFAHNDYLAILIELGIIGLLIFLNLIIQTLRNIFQKFILSKHKKYLIAFVGILIIFLIGFVDNILASTALLWIMWMYIAYLLS